MLPFCQVSLCILAPSPKGSKISLPTHSTPYCSGARDTERLPCADGASNGPIEFHKGQAQVARPVPVAICAGAAHSCALTAPGDGGVLLAWHSMDPHLRAQEVGGALLGQTVVAASAGKHLRGSGVTEQGVLGPGSAWGWF